MAVELGLVAHGLLQDSVFSIHAWQAQVREQFGEIESL